MAEFQLTPVEHDPFASGKVPSPDFTAPPPGLRPSASDAFVPNLGMAKSLAAGIVEPFGALGRFMTGRSTDKLGDAVTAAAGIAPLGPPGAGRTLKAGAKTVESGMAKAFHSTSGPFSEFDWSRLGQTVLPNVEGTSIEPWAMNLAKIGPWAHETDISGRMGATHVMPVDIGGKPKSFRSLDELESAVRASGGPEQFRADLVRRGFGHIKVKDEEMGGVSYIALAPEHFRIAK